MSHILVVDDEEGIRYTFERFLTDKGHTVMCAQSYEEALECFSRNIFDLIFLDIILGEKTGIDFLRTFRNQGESVPVILITGFPNVGTASEAVRLRAFDYLCKPIEKETLLQVTERALQASSAIRERELNNERLEAILRSVEDAIVTVDQNYIITGVNDGAKTFCGSKQETIGKDIRLLQTGCARKCLNPLLETMKRHQSVQTYRFECKKDGDTTRIVNVSSYPLMNDPGQFCGSVMIMREEPGAAQPGSQRVQRQRLHHLVGRSESMQKVFSLIDLLAKVESSVLIVGESGTGKELVAEAMHYLGARAQNALVKVNCSALSESLMESELFGHVRGAFTGATADRIGRFQKANGGTIFLDEIGDLSPKVQSSLLRVLQQKEFERVGDSNPIHVDARILTATNKDLDHLVKLGEFREDLLYRLKVVEIAIPPLRERKEDIPLLVEHFLAEFNRRMNKKIESISLDVEQKFQEYNWPGNIRELEHALEHACVLCTANVISLDNLPPHLRVPALTAVGHANGKIGLNASEIVAVLEKTGWNKKKAARLLGIDRKTLYRNIEKYGITTPTEESF